METELQEKMAHERNIGSIHYIGKVFSGLGLSGTFKVQAFKYDALGLEV